MLWCQYREEGRRGGGEEEGGPGGGTCPKLILILNVKPETLY